MLNDCQTVSLPELLSGRLLPFIKYCHPQQAVWQGGLLSIEQAGPLDDD